ncbi:unnamed protein product [Rotaria magnacalcarata]|uniref:Uncharacterized protein n=1 Tax=Rotaria magnacalcarata TaxID=392030 RepID=A0A816XCW6_9BILA|nr:unnamed protein product [Rotaria magnacalcarata]
MTGMIKLGYKNSWSDQIKNEGERKKTFTAISKRYRLFEGDSTTGSINSPLSPTSIVGVVSISSSIYSSINNQLCQSCTENRYEVCFASTNRCQCPTTDASNMPFGITVTGGCNGSSSTNQTILNAQVDIVLGYNNTLYIGDNSKQLYSFYLNNRTGRILRSFSSWPLCRY